MSAPVAAPTLASALTAAWVSKVVAAVTPLS